MLRCGLGKSALAALSGNLRLKIAPRLFARLTCTKFALVSPSLPHSTPQEAPTTPTVSAPYAIYLSKPLRKLKFKYDARRRNGATGGLKVEVDALIEGTLSAHDSSEIEDLLEQLSQDGKEVVQLAMLLRAERDRRYRLPLTANLSMVLCDDEHIRGLNRQYRGKDTATDVLSFEMPDDFDGAIQLPVKLLGDLVISVDTAAAQAAARGYSLLDELRVLLVHGVLHLCGYDHERDEAQAALMAEQEQRIMQALGWRGEGLISAANEEGEAEDGDRRLDTAIPSTTNNSSSSSSSSVNGGSTSSIFVGLSAEQQEGDEDSSWSSRQLSPSGASFSGRSGNSSRNSYRSSDIELVAIDMDGTLLNGQSKITPGSVKAIKAALAAGVTVMLATGKARPAALKACDTVGLAGDKLLVSPRGPGIFLQGLAVHGRDGRQISDSCLPPAVVDGAFRYSLETGTPLCAFLGDTCTTLRMTPELEELHHRYYEPLADVAADLRYILDGPPVRKLLFMTDPAIVDAKLIPHWRGALHNQRATVMQAVPEMMEIVPQGVNKWAGLELLLGDMGLSGDVVMAIGDGANDLEMVANAGLGVAMGNAVAQVKAAASVVVGSNDHDGVAEALERYVL